MRPIWKGFISFGLVNVPVTLYPAEKRTELSFHLLDSANSSRVRYERINADTGEEVPWNRIVKGFEYEKGSYVIISDEDFKRASPEATKTIDIESFVDLDEIDPIYFDKPYYLEPGKGGAKGYVLLRETLRESNKVGIAKVVIRTRQYLAAMAPRGKALALNLMRYQMEVRPLEDLDLPGTPASVKVSKQELKMAHTLVESMSRKWDPSEYHDEYRERLMKWIDERIEAGEFERTPEAEEPEYAPAPINLMEALKKSIAKPKPATKKTSRKKAG